MDGQVKNFFNIKQQQDRPRIRRHSYDLCRKQYIIVYNVIYNIIYITEYNIMRFMEVKALVLSSFLF